MLEKLYYVLESIKTEEIMKKYNLLRAIAVTLVLLFTFNLIPATAFAVGDDIYVDIDHEAIINQIADESDWNSKNPEDKKIITEDFGKRSANEKHFKLEDGSYVVAQYPDVVHYENEDGEWIDIDNTLIFEKAENENDFDGYTNKDNSFDVKLSKNGRDQLLRIDEDDYHISMKLVEDDIKKSIIKIDKLESIITVEDDITIEEKNNQIKQLDNLESKAEYIDILPGIDIEYVVQAHGVKEYIVVNEHKDSYVFTFELDLGNLVPYKNSDGSVSVMTVNGEDKYIIPTPYMYDDNYNYSQDVEYAIVKNEKGNYNLTVYASANWINDSNTKLPVKIDPSIVTVDDGAELQDVFVADSTTCNSTNFDYINNNYIGYHSNFGNTRTYINWEGLNKEEISSYVITSAKLKYHQLTIERDSTPTIVAHQVTGEWSDDTINGNNQPTYSNKILDYIDSQSISTDSIIEFDITEAILDYFNNINSNGIVLKAKEESTSIDSEITNVQLVSAEGNNDATKSPTLEIYYCNQKGIDDDYVYLPVECGNAGTAYINTFNGDVAFIHETLEVGSVKVNHIYNTYMNYIDDIEYNLDSLSSSYKHTKVGTGWKMSIQDIIVPIDESEYISGRISLTYDNTQEPYAYIYNDQYGTNVYLFKTANNCYEDQKGLGYTLSITTDGYILEKTDVTNVSGWRKVFKVISESYTYTTRDVGYITNYYSFTVDSEGVKIYDEDEGAEYAYVSKKYNASTGKGYPSRMKDITADYGDSVIGFTISSSNNKLQTISSDERTITFTYGTTDSATDNLRYIDDSEVGRTEFDYSGNTLTKVVAADGNELQFVYDSNGYLDNVQWKSSSSATPIIIDFTFNRGVTTVHYPGKDGISCISTNTESSDTETEISTDDLFIKYLFDVNGNSTAVYTLNYELVAHEAVDSKNHTGIEHIAINNPNMSYSCYAGEELIDGSGSFVLDTNSYNDRDEISISSDAHTGLSSYQLTSDGYSCISKAMSFDVGTHDFSAYIKCVNGITEGEIGFEVYDPYGDFYVSTEDISITNGWEELSYTFDIPQDGWYEFAIYVTGEGILLVDDIMIDNRGISWPVKNNAYTGTGFESGGIYLENFNNATLSTSEALFGDYSLKISDSIGAEKSVYHTYYLDGFSLSELDGFALSGWGKASSIPTTDPSSKGFELFAYFIYSVEVSEGVYERRTISTSIPFNWQNEEWQYVSSELNMPEVEAGQDTSFYSVTFGVLSKGNTGDIYFDNIELSRVTTD